MKKTNRKGFTLVELVIVIAVIAILAGVLIGTFASVIKRANDSARVQQAKNDEIAQKADDIIAKIENSNWFGWEDFEADLVAKLTKVYADSTLTEVQLKNAVNDVINDAVTTALANIKVENTGLTADDVKAIVENVMGTLKYEGVTEAQVRAIVLAATNSVVGSQITPAQIKTIVTAANEKNLTAAQVSQLIAGLGLAGQTDVTSATTTITTALSTAVANVATKEQVEELQNTLDTLVLQTVETDNVIFAKALNIKLVQKGMVYADYPYQVVEALGGDEAVKTTDTNSLVLLSISGSKPTFVVVKNDVVIYNGGTYVDNDYRLWTFADTVSTTYSTYLTADQTGPVEANGVGVDVGNAEVETLKYNGVSGARKVVIRTNGGTLTIDAEFDDIYHYGYAESVNVISAAPSSYHVNAEVKFLEVAGGHVVLEEQAEVTAIHFTATDGVFENEDGNKISLDLSKVSEENMPSFSRDSVTIEQNGTYVAEVKTADTEYIWLFGNGIKEQMVVTDTEGAIASNGELNEGLTTGCETGSVAEQIANPAKRDEQGQLVDNENNPVTVENAVVGTVTSKESVQIGATLFASGTGTESDPYLIATAQHWNNMYVSLHEQAIRETQLKLYFKLVNDIDLTNVALDTVHINNDKVTFSLDGNNHKVSGIHDFTGERYVFYKIKDTDIKNITLSYNGENTWMGLSYSTYGGVTRITGVTTEGTIYATGGWLCSFITYPYGTKDATGEDAYLYYKNCVNKTNHLGNAEYAAPFGAHAMTVKMISFENCSNTGTIAGQHASGFIGMTGGRTTQFEFVGENPAVNYGTIKTTSSAIGNARNFSTDEKKSGDNYKVTVSGTDYIVNVSGATLSCVADLNVTVASEMNGDITISNIADAEYYYIELTIARQGYNFNDSNLKNVWGGSLGSAELDFIVEKSNSDTTQLPVGRVYVCEAKKDRVDWRNRDNVVEYKGLYYNDFVAENGIVIVQDEYEEITCYQYNNKTFLYIDDYNTVGALTQANQNGTDLNLTVSFKVYAYDSNDILVGQKTVSYKININDAYNFFNGVENHFAN